MLCDICKKNQATVHLTEIINDQMSELHLCEHCAQEKSHDMEQKFGLSDLLAGLVQPEKITGEKESDVLRCPVCKLSYGEFKKIGRLGCANCYHTFKKYLAPLLKRIHGSSQHIGKKAVVMELEKEETFKPQEDLRAKLQKAIENEEFEEAARIRDQIRQQEKNANQ
ncbi:MAG: UvrB/UvrC motif-containing protein [Candidatus Omnitrophica bacterium]|jgi:protein arginine kinase activator|nr:UvrB/UvrC motif-containing protein [Candidatus Omnitrophota bacterium]